MRRNYSLALLTAAALASLTACSSSDDPTTDPSVSPSETVKTSFTLSVGLPNGNNSAAAKPSTRVSDAVAQAQDQPVFRGIDNINLIPFNTTVSGTTARIGNNITLPNTVANSLPSTELSSTLHSKVYNDVNIPLGTADFLFYGKAIDASAGAALTTDDQRFQYGTLNETGLSNATTPSEISFSPRSITTGTSENAVATALTTYLNKIAGTGYTQVSTGEGESTTSTWAAYAADNSTTGLGQLYYGLTRLVAGSSASIEDEIQDLYRSLVGLQPNTGSNEAALRDAIVANIADGTNANVNAGTTTLSFDNSLSGYPGNINLPDGAATLSFNSGVFSENTAQTTLANGTAVAALSTYAYPVNLWYFANTPIRTTEADLSDYTGSSDWNAVLARYGENNGYVNASTRSIALVNPIQYAVGRLQTCVKAAASTLTDREGNSINVTANTFPVTAILVGAQRPVDWQFQPQTATNTAQYTLYDKVPTTGDNTIFATADNAKYNQTLVLESPSQTELKNVKIVVELQNNSNVEFRGANGVIPVGSKFYLVAELDPANTGHTGDQPAGINQVFKQDYVTTANLTINANTGESHNQGLGAAYNVIPDLRTPVLSIGMSVDLSWQNGLTFDVNM